MQLVTLLTFYVTFSSKNFKQSKLRRNFLATASQNDNTQSTFMLFLLHMEQTEKKILRNNIIKFIIGLVLLGFSYGYMTNHPAEKASILSGFEVLRQRVAVYYHKVTKTNPEALQKKYSYEQTYQELIKMGEATSCVDPNVMTELNETFLALKKEPIKNLDVVLPGYDRKAREFNHMIENCSTK